MIPFIQRLLIIVIISGLSKSCSNKKTDKYGKVFDYYLLKEHQMSIEGDRTFLIIPKVHCGSCAESTIPVVEKVGFCPLSYITDKKLPLQYCENIDHLKDNGQLQNYNLPLKTITIVGYKAGSLKYLHNLTVFDEPVLKRQLDSLMSIR